MPPSPTGPGPTWRPSGRSIKKYPALAPLAYVWFVELLRHFLRARPIARMVALDLGFRLPLPGKTVIRGPAGVYIPLAPEDGVIRSRVLPGLQFRPADLLTQPPHETMYRDPVYADFVLPGWQETQRQVAAERAARHLAEARAAAAAQARQAAERALAELRAQLASRRPD